MQPNDLPIVCLPLELCDEDAATLIDFLHDLTEALERHYAGQLLRHARRYPQRSAPSNDEQADSDPGDPPF
jgi:hypothetical protein